MHGGLTGDRQALLAAAIDRLAPSDESGPGAVALGVVDFVERALSEGDEAEVAAWNAGLAALDACARRRHDRGFAALAVGDRDAILTDFERGAGGSGRDDEAAFFKLLRDHVLQGMFGDPSWGGNRDRDGWRLLGYPGPRLVWAEADQQLDVVPSPSPVPDQGGAPGG